MEKLNKEKLIDFLETMVKIRIFEITVERNFTMGNIYGTAHLAIGQEAVAVGSIRAIKDSDLITSAWVSTWPIKYFLKIEQRALIHYQYLLIS